MALFDGTTEQLQKFIPGLTSTFDPEGIESELLSAEFDLLHKFLGEGVATQLSELAEWSEDELNDPDNRLFKRALYLAQVAVVRIGFAGFLPFGELQIGNDGITVPSTPDRKAAFEYQTKSIKRSLTDTGWRALDELIKLVSSNPSLFPTWDDSPYYQEHQDAIFKNAAEFSRYYPIQDRWLTFWALRPFLQPLEEERGRPALETISALNDGVIKTKLIKALLRALALQAVLDALPYLSIQLDGANVQVNYASQYANIDYHTPPSTDQLSWVQANLKNLASLAWSSYEQGLSAQTGNSSSSDFDPGLIAGGGAITML